ncbi:MAG: hypothetical protein AUJ49_06375 [Desulfovibrionaceae bacterium CG1_02_65_16]|nr:MAG: hypothetical protein AUJ49_06375 [Desulfovibrionaceae bacterium CG1_02_65_16]
MTDETQNVCENLPETEHYRYGRILLGLTLAGALFLAGQAVRWWHELRQTARLEHAVTEVYRRALAGEPGSAPYGRLQFELGKLRALSAQRLDMVELLAALSRRAPEGVRITGVSMATASGVVSGLAATPEDFQRYQAVLAAEASFTFSVARVDTISRPLHFDLDVKVRDRAAPPKGDDQ